jgi:hypothetical protein
VREDHSEQVVEVVRDAASELAERLHLLRVM